MIKKVSPAWSLGTSGLVLYPTALKNPTRMLIKLHDSIKDSLEFKKQGLKIDL